MQNLNLASTFVSASMVTTSLIVMSRTDFENISNYRSSINYTVDVGYY